jgi:tetratricopeptide (TPR) repeat protein
MASAQFPFLPLKGANTASKVKPLLEPVALWQQARELLWTQAKPRACIALLTPWWEARKGWGVPAKANTTVPDTLTALGELLGLAHMQLGAYPNAETVFREAGLLYLQGYAALLGQNTQACHYAWTKLAEEQPKHWGLYLLAMSQRSLNYAPSFMQIRNFIETDISNLLRAKCWAYLENITCYFDYLAQINPEVYKLSGRSFLNEGKMIVAHKLLSQAQHYLPQDPEIYYHLGQYYEACQSPTEAVLMLKQAVMMNPTYGPAKELLEKLQAAYV